MARVHKAVSEETPDPFDVTFSHQVRTSSFEAVYFDPFCFHPALMTQQQDFQ